MPTRPDGLHIELGCGLDLSVGHEESRRVGVDMDAESLQQLRKRSPRSMLVCADAMAMPVRDESVASLSMRAVLHHLVPTETAIGEITRVLADGATLTIVDGVALDGDEAEAIEAELQSAGLPGEPMYGFDLDALTDQLADSGVVVESVEIDGTMTFATPPFVSRPYTSARFRLTARKTDAAGNDSAS